MTRYPYPARWLKLNEIVRKLDAGRSISPDEREFLAGPLKQAFDANQLDEIFDLEPRPKVARHTAKVLLEYRFAVGDHNTKERRETALELVAEKYSMEPETLTRILNRYKQAWLVPPRLDTADPASVPVRRRSKKKK